MAEGRGRWARAGTTAFVLCFLWGFLLLHFKPELLLLDTMDAGGDTPSFFGPIHHLRDVLLPAGNPLGWNLGNFAGYAPYQFYFLPPSLAIIALSSLISLNVAFKLVTVAGTFLLPLTTALCLRALGYAFPVPAIAAGASLVFLFNEGNSMWGGNIPSTLSGEFSFSIAFSLAVLAVGLLYRNVERQGGWRSLGALLALIGLCHPVAFVNATAPGLFFLLQRQHFARNLRFLLATYGTAVLLMGFWLAPLIGKLGYATSINWKWYFESWGELLPTILQPIAVLAGLNALWLVLFRRPEDRPARYLLFSLAITVVCFLNGTAVGLPEIRFVPFAYVLLVLLAVDFVRRVLPVEARRWPAAFPLCAAPHVAAIALTLCCAAWAQTWTKSIPSWIEWNYQGLEKKQAYPLLRRLSAAVSGSIGDPRVAYENSPKHDRFGSMRVFENMALFSGRATLEGVLLQTAPTSPFIYWLQSLISKQGTGVIPGYRYPEFDPSRGTPRLALFNAHDMIGVTPELVRALEADPRWERTFNEPPYAVFHLKGADPRYVRVPRFQPVLLETDQWKRDFHRWFTKDALLDVPLVAAQSVPPAERSRFAHVSSSPTQLPREPIEATCRIEERIEHLAIEFTTTCPGLPHWIAVSYFPNWHVEGASDVFLASPAFMLVFPESERVRLAFRRIALDWIGLGLSLGGLGLCFAGSGLLALGREPRGATARVLNATQPYALVLALTVLTLFTALSVARSWGPEYLYDRGMKAFQAEQYADALRHFELAAWLGGNSYEAMNASFFRAASLLRQGELEAAREGYEYVIANFAGSIWESESHYHVGLCLRGLGRSQEATERFQYVVATYPGDRWAGFAAEQLEQLGQATGEAAAEANG